MKIIIRNRKMWTLVFAALMILISFQYRFHKQPNNACTIQLKWFKSYEAERWEKVKVGMKWSLSYMGALLPKGSLDKSLKFYDSTRFEINLNELGFDDNAMQALSIICDSIKNTKEYKRNGYLDMAKFFVLTLYSPYHYYKITGAELDYSAFQKKYSINNSSIFGVTISAVSRGHRRILFGADATITNVGFVSEEGYGSLIDGTFKTMKFETMSIMPNGQFKYAIYDHKGRLTDASDTKYSAAGKPGKCMWCHETDFQPLRNENNEVYGLMTNKQFGDKIIVLQQLLEKYRTTLVTEIDFQKKQDHTQSELLYIGFMEPSAYRLQQELMNDSLALKKVVKLPQHLHDEFTFLGNLFVRKAVEAQFSYPRISVPDFVREKSKYEPNYFGKAIKSK